jgi:hypothetical protein
VSEEQALAVLADLGAPQLAVVFARSPRGIQKKAERLGVSVKKKSQINVAELSQVTVEYIRRVNRGAVCPACGKRLVAIEVSGLCGWCHKGVLIEAHNERLSELEQQREINRLKKAEQRIRDELGIVPQRSRRAREEAVTPLEE